MLKDFLKEAIVFIAGKPAEPIVDIIHSKKYVNEFLIAKKLELTINQVRNILYKLSNLGLASSIRKKDKKKGWFTYFWKLETIRTLEILKQNISVRTEQINNQIKNRETKQFYICEDCNVETDEEHALLSDFSCPECGEIYKIKDNSKMIKEFKRIEDKLKLKISLIEKEIKKEQEAIDKIKEKEIKKLTKEKEVKKKTPEKKKEIKKSKKEVKKKTPEKKKEIKKSKKEVKKKTPEKKKELKKPKKEVKKKVNS